MTGQATTTQDRRGSPKRESYQFRIDTDLLDDLKRDADAYGRTVSQSIRWHLRRSLDQEQAA